MSSSATATTTPITIGHAELEDSASGGMSAMKGTTSTLSILPARSLLSNYWRRWLEQAGSRGAGSGVSWGHDDL